MRRQYGHIPGNGKKVAEHGDWELYVLPSSEFYTHEWHNCKLICASAQIKANYWLVYNSLTGVFRRNKDAKLLYDYAPTIYDLILGVLWVQFQTVHNKVHSVNSDLF